MQVNEFAEHANRAESLGELLALVQREAEERGFDRYAFCDLTPHGSHDARNSDMLAVAHNYPVEWIEY